MSGDRQTLELLTFIIFEVFGKNTEMREERRMKLDIMKTEEIQRLEIQIDYADMEIADSADENIHVEAEGIKEDCFSCGVTGETLRAAYRVRAAKLISIRKGNGPKIRLYLPAGLMFSEASVSCGAGDLNIRRKEFACGKLVLSVGAGNMRVEQVVVEQELRADIGAGKLELISVKPKNMEVLCGVGEFLMRGDVAGSLRTNCGVGNCQIFLERRESDYDYDISCALGSVRVNEHKISCIGSEHRHSGAGTIGTVTLECGIGEISLETAGR